MYPKLNFPIFKFKFKITDGKKQIFDVFRKKYVHLTPEEWVRQHLLMYLCEEKNFPKSLLEVEKKVSVNGMNKRCDAVFYNNNMHPLIMIECKSYNVKISSQVFDQIARYHLFLESKLLLISNGITHFCCSINKTKKGYDFYQDIPNYMELNVFE